MLCIAGLAISMLGLAGCGTGGHGKSDIEAYVTDTCGLKNFSVSDSYQGIKDDEGFTDRLWTVVDKDRNLTFYVLDDYIQGNTFTSNHLWDDFQERVFMAELGKMPALKHFTLEKRNSNPEMISINASYQKSSEIKAIADELLQVKKHFDEIGFSDMNITCVIRYNNPLRKVTAYDVTDGDLMTGLKNVNSNVAEDIEKRCVLCSLDYRFEDILSNYSKDYIEDVVKNNKDCHRLGINKDGNTQMYSDLVASRFSYGVSFGTLYEVLKREGISVTGNLDHYQFTGVDGNTYEISYDFRGESYEVTENNKKVTREGYYYIKNGEKTKMSYYFYNHFTVKAIKEMTGLDLVTVKNK